MSRQGKRRRKREEDKERKQGHISGSESEWIDAAVSTQRAPSPKHRREKLLLTFDPFNLLYIWKMQDEDVGGTKRTEFTRDK